MQHLFVRQLDRFAGRAQPRCRCRVSGRSFALPNERMDLIAMRAGGRVSRIHGASRSGSPGSVRPSHTPQQKSSKLTRGIRARGPRQSGSGTPLQLPLLFGPPIQLRREVETETAAPRARASEEVLDQCMSTREVLRIVGVNRSTVFRWIRKGLFPQKHVAGGWLRSDVERWLAARTRLPE